MAYDQHSSYEAPRRGYYDQSGGQHSSGRQPAQPSQEYGTYDPYAQDAGNPYAESSNGYGQEYGQDNRTLGYARPEPESYSSQGSQGYGNVRPQEHQRRAPPQQMSSAGYGQRDRQYSQAPRQTAYAHDGYSHQGGRGYEQQQNGWSHPQQRERPRPEQNGRHYGQRGYDQQYDTQSSQHGYDQYGSQTYGQQGQSRPQQSGYDRQPAPQGYSGQSQRVHDQQNGYGSSSSRQNGYDQQHDERRYDPRYQQRQARTEHPQHQSTGSAYAGQPRPDPRQPARPALTSNGSLQSSQSAPILQNAGPKKLTMAEWKAQEKAKMHSEAGKPKVPTQDNAFPTFPTKKAESTRGQSAMSMRSGEERPGTASSTRREDRPSISRNPGSQQDVVDSPRPSMDRAYGHESARPSMDSQHRNGLSQRDHAPPPAMGRPARKDSYGTSARPVVTPLDTSAPQRASDDAQPLSPGRSAPADPRYARKPVEQPMSPLGKFAQSAQEPQYSAYSDKQAQPLSREEEIEAEMPDFDSAAPWQLALRQRRQTIEQHLTPAQTQPKPAQDNFDFGFSSPHLERPVQPYANETQERRSMDDTRQGSRSLVNGRPPPQRFYPEAPPQRPGMDRQGTTFSDPGMQRADSVPPQNPDALPAHPVPMRAGLMSGSPVPAARPPPVRNYQNATPQPQPQPQPSSSSRAPSGAESAKSAKPQPITHAELQQLRTQVESNPQSLSLSLTYAKKLVEAAKVLSSENGRADAKTAAKNRERYLMEAYKRVKKLASSGYPDGQFYLADCYGQGMLGLEVDPREAFKLYQAAAKAGHAAAAYRTAVCCEIGSDEGGGTSRDYPRAVQWYKRAAALGETAAMFKVGMIALKGLLGQPRHLGEATIWLKRAAERADQDNPHALHELAHLYETANSTPDIRQKIIPDDPYALSLYKKAAELGSKNSQFRLGQCYEYGQLGLPVDHRSSIAWYSKSAAQGNHEAELALSGWYLTGAPGILQQSDVEAYLWARKAAQSEPPLAKSLFALGYYNEAGIGCPVNIDEAKRWYSRAASYKHPKALERLDAIKRGAKGGYKAMPTNARGKLNRRDQHQDESECSIM